jgi:serine protease DegS
VNRLDLVAHAVDRRPGTIGASFESQLGETLVRSVVPGGPADRAGLVAGDTVLKLNDQSIAAWMGMDESSPWPAGTTLAFTIERGDTQMTVQITVDPAP